MNIYDIINLPAPSKYLISLLLKKGGKLEVIKPTNAYVVKLKNKELIFLGEFTPLMPYTYGIVFSNQKYWFEILKELKIKYAWEPNKRERRVKFLITKDGQVSALLEKPVFITGDGDKKLRELIAVENIVRINSKNRLLKPVLPGKLKISYIPKKGKIIQIPGNFDLEDISEKIDGKFVRKAYKMIKFLPGLSFLAFELFTKDPEKIDSFVLGKVLVSPGEHIFTKVSNILIKYLIGI